MGLYYIEAVSQDISQEVKSLVKHGSQCSMTPIKRLEDESKWLSYRLCEQGLRGMGQNSYCNKLVGVCKLASGSFSADISSVLLSRTYEILKCTYIFIEKLTTIIKEDKCQQVDVSSVFVPTCRFL